MKKWVESKEPSGAVVHTLVFGHHGDDPKVIVALFRDSEGDWFTTSNVLDTYWDLLTGKEMCEHDAKMMVEEKAPIPMQMVRDISLCTRPGALQYREIRTMMRSTLPYWQKTGWKRQAESI